MVTTLLHGLTYKESSRTCIVALTACSMEMPKTMYKMIEKVLLSFSRISATKHVATPMLEFLSTLIRLPEVFCSFIDKTYFTVFAIALPFTNPFKFNHYTVSLPPPRSPRAPSADQYPASSRRGPRPRRASSRWPLRPASSSSASWAAPRCCQRRPTSCA